jgi:hypothetical protein
LLFIHQKNIDEASTRSSYSEGESASQFLHVPEVDTDPCSLATLGLFFIPESPRWYVARGKLDQAKQSLVRLNGKVKEYNIDHELAILSKEVADGQKMTKHASSFRVWEVLKGINLVSPIVSEQILALVADTYSVELSSLSCEFLVPLCGGRTDSPARSLGSNGSVYRSSSVTLPTSSNSLVSRNHSQQQSASSMFPFELLLGLLLTYQIGLGGWGLCLLLSC